MQIIISSWRNDAIILNVFIPSQAGKDNDENLIKAYIYVNNLASY